MANCPTCNDGRWVCEDHMNVPWDDGDGCCGGAGAPCPDCNPCDREHPPAMSPGTTLIWDRDRGYLN